MAPSHDRVMENHRKHDEKLAAEEKERLEKEHLAKEQKSA